MPIEASLPENRQRFLSQQVTHWQSVVNRISDALANCEKSHRLYACSPQIPEQPILYALRLAEMGLRDQLRSAQETLAGAEKFLKKEFPIIAWDTCPGDPTAR